MPKAYHTPKSHPIGKGWNKCASVTSGGKPYFFARRDPVSNLRQWYWKYEESKPDGTLTPFFPDDPSWETQ